MYLDEQKVACLEISMEMLKEQPAVALTALYLVVN